MLGLIDHTFESFLRDVLKLDPTGVDISFEPPDRQWSARLSRPTINAFLWDIRRSTSRARTGLEEFEDEAGRTVRRLALPVVELRYVVTVWTSDHSDERELLGGVMGAVLEHSEFPTKHLPQELVNLRPPSLLMARAGEAHADIFKALDGQLKPGINVIVSAEVDNSLAEVVKRRPDAGVSLAFAEGWAAEANPDASDVPAREPWGDRRLVAGDVLVDGAEGLLVWGPIDAAIVNSAGQFLIRARPGDQLVLQAESPMNLTVPDQGGVRFE